jgi:pilus assembly protein Flp/PilA
MKSVAAEIEVEALFHKIDHVFTTCQDSHGISLQNGRVNFGASNRCYSGVGFGGKTIEAGPRMVWGIRSIQMKNLVARFAKDESGATAIEYGLIAALISVVIIGVLSTLGTRLNAKFSAISNQLQ